MKPVVPTYIFIFIWNYFSWECLPIWQSSTTLCVFKKMLMSVYCGSWSSSISSTFCRPSSETVTYQSESARPLFVNPSYNTTITYTNGLIFEFGSLKAGEWIFKIADRPVIAGPFLCFFSQITYLDLGSFSLIEEASLSSCEYFIMTYWIEFREMTVDTIFR